MVTGLSSKRFSSRLNALPDQRGIGVVGSGVVEENELNTSDVGMRFLVGVPG
jgi:hypothetical protein